MLDSSRLFFVTHNMTNYKVLDILSGTATILSLLPSI